MGNPFFGKQFRMMLFGGFGVILILYTLMILLISPYLFIPSLILTAIFLYLGFGIDFQRKNKASKRLDEFMQENKIHEPIIFIEDSYLNDVGRGHLAITEHYFFFMERKGEIISIDLHSLTSFGYQYVGTGHYSTTYHNVGSFRIGSTTEGKLPVFYLETVQNNKEYVLAFYCFKHKKIYKILDQNWSSGTLSKERKEYEEQAKQAQLRKEDENELLLNHFNLIMDPDLNRLDRGRGVLLQNGEAYKNALYNHYKKTMPKLHALTEEEDNYLNQYFLACLLRGHRIAASLITANGSVLPTNDIDLQLPGDRVSSKYESIDRIDYPVLEQICYAQYKGFRSSGFTFLSESEAIEMSREFIIMSYKNSLSNYLVLTDLVDEK